MKFECFCGQPIEVNENAAGQSFACPSCGTTLVVPTRTPSFAAPPIITPPKRSTTRRTAKIAGGILLSLVIIGGCNSLVNDTPSSPTPVTSRQVTPPTTPQFTSSDVKVKEWSFQVTSDWEGFHLTDGPALVLKYVISNPTPYKVSNAKWTAIFYDFNDNLIKRVSFKTLTEKTYSKPQPTISDDLLLGFKDLQFNPARIHSMKLILDDVAVSPYERLNLGESSRVPETPTPEEANLLTFFPHLKWSRQQFVDDGWLGPFQTGTHFFTKKTYPLFRTSGEIQFSFEDEKWGGRMYGASFWVNNDMQWRTLYQIMVEITKRQGTEKRTESGQNYIWAIYGTSTVYTITLYHEKDIPEDPSIGIDVKLSPR